MSKCEHPAEAMCVMEIPDPRNEDGENFTTFASICSLCDTITDIDVAHDEIEQYQCNLDLCDQ